MIKDVTKEITPEALELNIEPTEEVMDLILRYSKSIEVVEVAQQATIINYN